MNDMLLSSHERLADLKAINYFCSNKSILDIGANIGHLGLQALSTGCKHVTCVEIMEENIKVIKHMLPKNKITIIKADLTQENSLLKIDGNFDTIFYLAVHQHLEKRSKGSGIRVLNYLISLKPKQLVIRSKGYTSNIKDIVEKAFGELNYYSHLDSRIAPILGFRAY